MHLRPVLWTTGCILLMLWALGDVAGGTVGQWVHLLLALALLHFLLALLKAGRHLPRSRGEWPARLPGTPPDGAPSTGPR